MAIKWNSHITNLQVDPATGPSGGVPVCIPNVASTLESSYTAAGQIYYDSSNSRIRAYVNGSWTTLQTSAGSGVTLDQAYDQGGAGAGRTITASDGAVAITVSNTSNNAALVLTQNDTTNNPVTLTITNAGTGNDITATNWSLSKTGTLATTGNVTCAGITSSGTAALTTVTCTTLTTTTLSLTTLNSPTIQAAAAGNTNLTVDASGSGTIGIGTVSTGAITLGAAVTVATGKSMTFTNGNLTLSAGTIAVTAGAGDGDAVSIIPLVTQSGITLTPPTAYNLSTGLIDINPAGTGTGPIVAVAFASTYTGDVLQIDMTTAVGAKALNLTGAGVRTVAMITITDTPSTIGTFDLNITPAGAAAGANVFDIDVAGTGTANVYDLAFAAAYAGDAFHIDMTNAVGANALDITGAGSRTAPLITITDVPTTSAPTLDMNITAGTNAVQSGIDIDVAGTATSEIINIDFSAAFTGDALNITMTNGGAAAQAIVVDGSLAASGPIVEFVTTGILTNAGSVLTVKNTTQPGAASTGVTARFLETGAAQATTYCVKIDSTSNEALNVSTGKSHFAESITVLAGASSGPPVFGITANYIATESGSNNAIAGALTDDTGTAVALTAGLVVVVKLAHTLQAGANTFNFNAGGALSIVSSRNSANNIGTAYASTGIVALMYNGATWSDLSQ